MNKKELADKLGLSEKALEGFSDETLNEMAQEAIQAGHAFAANTNWECGDVGGGCESVNSIAPGCGGYN